MIKYELHADKNNNKYLYVRQARAIYRINDQTDCILFFLFFFPLTSPKLCASFDWKGRSNKRTYGQETKVNKRSSSVTSSKEATIETTKSQYRSKYEARLIYKRSDEQPLSFGTEESAILDIPGIRMQNDVHWTENWFKASKDTTKSLTF